MALTKTQVEYLNWVETTRAWEHKSIADVKANLARLRSRYQMPDVTMAAFILEIAMRIRTAQDEGSREAAAAIGSGDAGVAIDAFNVEIGLVWAELSIMAACLTRKERGRPAI